MKKWTNAVGAIILALLLGTLALLGCYFFSDLMDPSALQTEPSFTTQAPTTQTTVPTTAAPTTQATTVPTETTQPTVPAETTVATEPTTVPVTEPVTEPATQPTEPTTKPTEPEPTQPKPTEPKPTEPEPTEPKPTEPKPTESDDPLDAEYAAVYDLTNGSVLYSKGNLWKDINPASITKLLTVYTAMKHLEPDDKFTVGYEITKIVPDSSIIGLYQGQRISVETCVAGMLLGSGNDAAYALAAATGRAIRGDTELGSTEALQVFMDEMNAQASALGMTGSYFLNPDGISVVGHYTTVADLLVLAQASLNEPLIAKYAKTAYYTTTFNGSSVTWSNTNLLINEGSSYYNPYAIGLKTGTTTKAGKCLLSAFQKDGRTIIVCVMKCDTDEARFKDTLYLFNQYG